MMLVLDLFLALELANFYCLHIAPEMFFSEIGAILLVTVLIVSSGMYLRRILGERLRAQEIRHRMDLLSKRVNAERKQTRDIVEASDEMRRQGHDFKHRLAIIRECNDRGDRDKLDAYLSEIGAAVPGETTTTRFCENFAIDAVARYYLKLAHEDGVDCIDIKLDVPRNLDASVKNDLAGIVGNLLENGVRAAAEARRATPRRSTRCVFDLAGAHGKRHRHGCAGQQFRACGIRWSRLVRLCKPSWRHRSAINPRDSARPSGKRSFRDSRRRISLFRVPAYREQQKRSRAIKPVHTR